MPNLVFSQTDVSANNPMTRTLLIILTFALFNLRTSTKYGRPLPTLFFAENSTSYSSYKSSSEIITDTNEILNHIAKIMADDKTIEIQIIGHADFAERHPKNISVFRVKKVYNDLKGIGVDTIRLSIVAYGDSRALISKKQINKCNQEADKKNCFGQLRQMNRRVNFNSNRVKAPNTGP